MIREYSDDDLPAILEIWLSASIEAHAFVEEGFWRSRLDAMRDVYIPAADTVVYEGASGPAGFYCLLGDTLAAIFVAPDQQGQGIGSALMAHAKQQRQHLKLTVYKANKPSVRFYEKQGFRVVAEQVDGHTGQPELVMQYAFRATA